jgi:hypothetical protein
MWSQRFGTHVHRAPAIPDLNIFALSHPSFSDGYGVLILQALNHLIPGQTSLLIQKQKPVSFHHAPTQESGFGRSDRGPSFERIGAGICRSNPGKGR